eukprot:11612700-Karenia_brevis.AAC.1
MDPWDWTHLMGDFGTAAQIPGYQYLVDVKFENDRIAPLFGGRPKMEATEHIDGEATVPAGTAKPEGVDSLFSFDQPKGKSKN